MSTSWSWPGTAEQSVVALEWSRDRSCRTGRPAAGCASAALSAADSRDLPLTMPWAVTTPFLTRAPKVPAGWPVIVLQVLIPGPGAGGFTAGAGLPSSPPFSIGSFASMQAA